MRLFALYEGLNPSTESRLRSFSDACRQKGVEFTALNSLQIDYSHLPTLSVGDLLYNCARGSETLESLLLNQNIASFYRSVPLSVPPVDTVSWSVAHAKAQLQSPKTIFSFTSDRTLLRKYIEYLGGFPIILKARSGTRGIGVIKIDNWETLFSTVDYLCEIGVKLIMRQFIPNTGTARLVVLGTSVIASEFRDNLPNDFRVSGTHNEKNYYARQFAPEVEHLAIAATHEANLETAGVDIILNAAGEPFLLEINFPHDFVPPASVTGVPIALKMLEWLIAKASQIARQSGRK